MHAMQYEITLPADYDMGIIHERVATKGPLLDDFRGLGIKAFLVREREDGSPVNQYAPFYLWTSPEGMNSFLWGPGFQGIVNDFGRPVVQHWTGLAYTEGPASTAAPRIATRRKIPVPAHTPPAQAVAEALARHAREAEAAGAVASALAVDPRHWELLHLTLWAADSPEVPTDADVDRFRVLHLSAPERGLLGGPLGG
ncbi:DUF4865 family protein [Streptomyces sp. NPDC008121]|uniref:DUF4865 family protein n=1 Tax=Streptomyces sp. NPDC008121 TaxID=3364809 RepID=UPI0036EA070C